MITAGYSAAVITSTLPERRRPEQIRRSRMQRRIGLALLVLFVLAGAVGLLGTWTTTTTVRGDGYEMSVTYPRISRPAHPVKVQVEVRKQGGFDDAPLTLRYSTDYLQMFDENAFTPQPDSETAGPGFTEDEFSTPDGEVFVMTVDTRIEPSRQRGEDGEVTVVEDGEPVLTARFSTWIWP
jgi:hypothetical protein